MAARRLFVIKTCKILMTLEGYDTSMEISIYPPHDVISGVKPDETGNAEGAPQLC